MTRGITAIETRLGWNLSRKKFESDKTDSTKSVLNLHVAECQVSGLWRLDILRILDPIKKESKAEIERVTEDKFSLS